ncbi:hypothetical protein [Fulvivirga sediminis]|uniref:Uncharacterized protein n=1 Tax=Fulvivirga sediminis TaxID=2803949 RepID=A0A937F801_9BACT|nr:hypothetical protein [Fulvivirga sediminis]MBL3656707.1 hypothetical protein [Fulvivirga sediminis]
MRLLKSITPLFLLLLLVSCDKKLTKEEFIEARAAIDYERSNLLIYSAILEYYWQYGSYPKSLAHLDSIFDIKEYDNRFKTKIKDPFNKQNNEYLYLPIYANVKDSIPRGFYLISEGVDQTLSTSTGRHYTLQDTTEIPIYKISALSYDDDKLEEKDLLIYRSIGDEPIFRNFGIPKVISKVSNELKSKFISIDVQLFKSSDQFFGRGISDTTKVIRLGVILNPDFKLSNGEKVNIKGIFTGIVEDTLYFKKTILGNDLIGFEEVSQRDELRIEAID